MSLMVISSVTGYSQLCVVVVNTNAGLCYMAGGQFWKYV